MSRTTITRAAAKAEARAIQANSKNTANPLTYTQALAEVAKRHGFANVHEMTSAYDAPHTTRLPAGWPIVVAHPLLDEIERHKGKIIVIRRRPDDGMLNLLESHFSRGGYAYLPAFQLEGAGPLIMPDLHLATPGSKLDAIIIDGLDHSARKEELLAGIAKRKLYDKELPEGTTIIVTLFDDEHLAWELFRSPNKAVIVNPQTGMHPVPKGWLRVARVTPHAYPAKPTAADLAGYFSVTGESLQFPKDLWRQAVRREETIEGYWKWVEERHRTTGIQPRKEGNGPFKVSGYERDRYTDGKRVYDDRRGFYDGKIRDFEDGSYYPGEPEAYAAQLNAIHAAGGNGAAVIEHAIANGLAVHVLEPARLAAQGLKGLPFKGLREMVEADESDDGTGGQDRDSYSDDQDRDSYTVEE